MIYQGSIETDGSTKITSNKAFITIGSIIINNQARPYSFMLYRLNTAKQAALIYKFNLDAGDSIRDDDEYKLYLGESLQLVSDVKGGTYIITAV